MYIIQRLIQPFHFRGHNYPIWCSTGLYIATGSRDLTARLWSTDREYPLQTYVGHTQDEQLVPVVVFTADIEFAQKACHFEFAVLQYGQLH